MTNIIFICCPGAQQVMEWQNARTHTDVDSKSWHAAQIISTPKELTSSFIFNQAHRLSGLTLLEWTQSWAKE